MMTPYRLLLTGMSGTGKSTLIIAFRARGVATIDMDEPGWSHHDADGHQHWNVERLDTAMTAAGDAPLVIAGCAETQVQFYPRCTHIVLLTAPRAVMIERIRTRTDNPYGKRPEDLAAILRNLDEIEPLLRRRATLVIDTDQPLAGVMTHILTHVAEESPRTTDT